MKKLVAQAASEVLYYLGHWISFPMHWRYGHWIYPIYNKLMFWSSDIQEWGDTAGPWTTTKEEE